MSVDWRGGVLYENYFITCDWQDIYYFNTTNWALEYTYSRNYFNNLHYLEVHNDCLFVVNTGLDAIEVFQNPLSLRHTNTHYIFETHRKYFEYRDIDRSKNYKDIFKLKSSCFPNAICCLDNHLLVSCCEPGNCIIDLVTRQIVVNNVPCHNVMYHERNLYVTAIRDRKVYVIKDILERKWPVVLDDYIDLEEDLNWFGGVTKDGFMVLFGSKLDKFIKVAIIDLASKKVNIQTPPAYDGIKWSVVYQPVIYE
jgi:hypothetical protein